MSNNEPLWNWKLNLGIALTPVILITSQQKQVCGTSLNDSEVINPLSVTQTNSRLKTQPLPQIYLAQNQVPNPIPPRTPEPPIKDPQPQPKPPVELNPAPTPTSPELLEIPGTITVKQFKFIDNTAFSDAELKDAVKKLTGKPISFAELLQAEEIIKSKYTVGCQGDTPQPCYINSGAFIPANQTFTQDNATITIKVVEGGIENIEITGLKKLRSGYIRSQIQRGISQPLEREKLLEQLQILQLDPLIQNISAELAAGTRPEKSVLELSVTEADPFFTEFFTDNARAPSVGSWRRGIRFNEGNLFGFGDRLGGEYVNTNGSNAVDLSYSVPITARNTTIDIRGGVTSTEVVEEPFDRADIVGDSFNFEFGVRQPVYRTPTTEIAVGLTGTRQESNTEVLGENFQLSPGADANGETRISALRFNQEYTKRTLQDVLALRSQFNVGLDIFDSTVNEDPLPDSRFFAWRGQGQYVRRLGQNSLVVVRSDLQLSPTNLVPLEQFSVGGIQSVRGYRQDALLTDNGFFTSAEVRLPIYQAQSVQGLLSVAPFLDFGVGWNDNSDDNPEENVLFGLGLGLQWQMGDKLNARLDYGIPLTDVQDNDNTLQEDGVYFSVNYSPF
jgi:hemolysin activation/secretion protein